MATASLIKVTQHFFWHSAETMS